MKNRSVGLLALTLVALPLVGTLLWFQMAYEESLLPQLRRTGLAPPPVIPETDASDLARMEHLMPRLAVMSQPTLSSRRGADLALLGYVTPKDNPVVMNSSGEPTGGTEHTLSMAFVTPTARKAMIDGTMRKEGDELEDGSRVVRILPGKVVLRAPNGEEKSVGILFPENAEPSQADSQQGNKGNLPQSGKQSSGMVKR